LSASKRFGRYKDEKEKAVRKASAQESEALAGMRKAFGAVSRPPLFEDTSASYHTALKAVAAMEADYSAEDVERFSLMLGEFQDEENFMERAGLLLSALMNNGKDGNYTIHTQHLEGINFLGYRNTKRVVVEGDVGNDAGTRMKEGELIIRGDGGLGVGFQMHGGSILVEGDADENLGMEMTEGEINVKGTAGDGAGYNMKGGLITIWKDAGELAGNLMEGGKILIHGNARKGAGTELKGGVIVVKKNAHALLGNTMYGGTIVVEGNASTKVGKYMRGGEIHIEGRCKSVSSKRYGGDVYVQGRIVP
jgi:formylmethanofuran dehydrogenase subunit C